MGAKDMAKIDKFEMKCLECGSKRVIAWTDVDYSIKFECLDCKNQQSTKIMQSIKSVFKEVIQMNKKPPLGLEPRRFWEMKIINERLNDIGCAIERYSDSGLEIPVEWENEYEIMKQKLIILRSRCK